MRSFTLVLGAMAVAGVNAQLDWAKLNAPGAAEYYYGIIPKCVVDCTKKGLSADGCPIDDFACHCQKGTQKITDVIGPCLASNTTMCLQSELANFGALVEGLCSYLNTTHMEPTPVPTSYTTTTQLVTITSCPPTVTDCPVGKVVTSTIVVPCDTTATTPAPPVITTPAPPMISSSSMPVTSYTTTTQVITVTSCPPTVTNCPIGKVITSTITVPCDTSSIPPPPITTPTPPIVYTTSVPYANTTMTRTRTKSRSSSMSSASTMSSMSGSTSMMSSMSSSTRTRTKTRSSSMSSASSMSSMSASTSSGMTSYITTTYTVTGSCSGCPYPVTTTIPVIPVVPVVPTGGPTPPADMTTPVTSYTPTSSMPAVWTGAASNLKVGGAIGAIAIGALMAL